MKRRLSLLACLSTVALSALPLCAQVTLLPAEETLPAQTAPVSAKIVEQAPGHLNGLQQQEWVVLDANGSVHGLYAQLNPDGSPRMVDRVAISLSRNGVAVQSTISEPDGHFAFGGLGVGTYALVAKSAGSVAAFALHVLPAGASSRLDSNFIVFGTSAGGTAVANVLRSHAVPSGNLSGYYPDLQSDPLGDQRRFSEGAQVKLRGTVLVGRISRPAGLAPVDLSGNMVHVMLNGRIVGQGVTNADGEFQIPNIAPGVYDLVIAGKDGVAAGAFRAVEGPGVALKSNAATKLVTAQPDVPDALNLELVAPGDYFAGDSEQVLPPVELGVGPGMTPVPGAGFVGPGGFAGGGGGGGFGGGAGGGGGVGGGRMGLGALLGIGGLAAGVVALAMNDDDEDLSP